MYTVVMGAGTDDERTLTKARAIASLPATENLSVIVVHASDIPGERDATTERTTDFFAERSIGTTVEQVDTDPQTALLEVASEHEADLLCVGGREHSPAGKVQFRSGAQSVILNADRPVLVAGEPTNE